MHPEFIKWLIKVLYKTNFDYKDKIFEDFEEVINKFGGLKPKFDNRTKQLGLLGVIPVKYNKDNVTYNIPIAIWIKYKYPAIPPDFYVTPAENMRIVDGHHVAVNGKISHHYLNTYITNPESSLAEFITILQDIFSNEIPLVVKRH